MPESYRQVSLVEKIIAVLTYLSMGFVGFICLIIFLIRRANLSKFMQYHIFQSIFISLAYVLICYILGFILNILSLIPFINVLAAQIALLFNSPVLFGFSIIQTAIYLLLFYLAGGAVMGKFTRIPWVSDIISYNVR